MPQKTKLLEYLLEGRTEAGCDEAGRGPLAGPVFAAAVILPKGFYHPLLNDSKKMSRSQRDILRHVREEEAVAWAVEMVSAQEIDNMNILWASVTGMQRAVRNLKVRPDFLLIDGNRFRPFDDYRYQTVIHGDATYASIAAASVLARAEYVSKMKSMSLSYKIDFPKGASDKVIQTAKEYSEKYGKSRLNEVAKLHFKTINNV